MKKPIHSVTIKDCRVTCSRGTGKGGQKRNKTSSAVRVFHEPSGALGYSDASRSQHDNKRDAFAKMTRTQEFCQWHTREIARIMNICDPLDIKVEVGV